MKRNKLLAIILTALPISGAYADWGVHPSYTSMYWEQGVAENTAEYCESYIDWDNCEAKEGGVNSFSLSPECESVCADVKRMSVTTETISSGNIVATYPMPQIIVLQGCGLASNWYNISCRWATGVEASYGARVAGKGTVYCKEGYYGTPKHLDDDSACKQCPSSGGVAGKSVVGSNTSITGCYIPSGSSFSDSTGSGVYTNNCYWKE